MVIHHLLLSDNDETDLIQIVFNIFIFLYLDSLFVLTVFMLANYFVDFMPIVCSRLHFVCYYLNGLL